MKNYYFLALAILFFGCSKTEPLDTASSTEEIESRKPPKPGGGGGGSTMSFTNCNGPWVSGNIVAGTAVTVNVTLIYSTNSGGSYAAFTSAVVNGMTLQTPAGTLATAGGTITFVASGTPVNPGTTTIPVSINGATCNVPLTVVAAASGSTDPGPAVGSTGSVTFNYIGNTVTYATVRASDGRIWLQQSLGAGRVATGPLDEYAFGHYFQWGRWDDGHQFYFATVPSNTSLQNPSHIVNGDHRFITGTNSSNFWWSNGSVSDTWSGTTATATNGKDPCAALGSGWRLPTAAEWSNIVAIESIHDEVSAFESNLKLTNSGYRNATTGNIITYMVGGYYWSNTANSGNTAKYFVFDEQTFVFGAADRGYGFSCRCIK
ncbi:MAG TPA: hypothetical protein VFZ47_03180 [Chitinophagaceae bacterium]